MTTKAKEMEISLLLPIAEETPNGTCEADEPLNVRPLIEDLRLNLRWQRLPQEYMKLEAQELSARVRAARERLGARAVILGHHYQREDIIQFADFKGDSLKLSQYAASRPESEFILFCGVNFMAETADILRAPHQTVIHPNLTAGCSMAEMAPTQDVLDAWDELAEVLDKNGIIPVTYMNSTADLKAFCGRNGGIVCTSSNAEAAIRWGFQRGEKVLFFPDQHLGRNTALKMGIPLSQMALWDPFQPLGGNPREALESSRVILWKGHCSVHTRFTVEQVRKARAEHPSINILVHPECTMEVVQEADLVGSTEFIARSIAQAPPGSKWAVGTEVNLVSRLAKENPDKLVFCLDPVVCPCSHMYRIHPAYLCWTLENLAEGRVVNRVEVDPETKHWARIALERMLALA